MWVMYVERVVGGDYFEPEIKDLEDGTGCLFKFHERDISEDGVPRLSRLLTEQAQRWAPRPEGASPGPVIIVRFNRVKDLPNPFFIRVEERDGSITYTLDDSLISEHAAEVLGRLNTERSPYWQRVPEDYHQGLDDAI